MSCQSFLNKGGESIRRTLEFDGRKKLVVVEIKGLGVMRKCKYSLAHNTLCLSRLGGFRLTN